MSTRPLRMPAFASACLALAAVLQQQPNRLVELLENAEGPGHKAITAALRQHETGPRLSKRLHERLTLSGTELADEALVQKQANLSLGLLALRGCRHCQAPICRVSRGPSASDVPNTASSGLLPDRAACSSALFGEGCRRPVCHYVGNWQIREFPLLDLDKES